jgi:hypothetical protein
MLLFDVFSRLFPDAKPWRPKDRTETWLIGDDHEIGEPGLLIDSEFGAGHQLWRYVKGLAEGAPAAARAFVDSVWAEAFPATTTHLEDWERQFGLDHNGTDTTRRLRLAAEWAAGGGQSPSYIQGVLQTAGFDVYVHEWWSAYADTDSDGIPDTYVARDPRDYTTNPRVGTYQCVPFSHLAQQPQCTGYALDGEGNPIVPLSGQPQCNAFLANETRYLVNKDLTQRAPPPVPDDPARWPYFLYFASETFPVPANVPPERRNEFERLLLKLCPAQQWIVLVVIYGDGGTFDDTFDETFS